MEVFQNLLNMLQTILVSLNSLAHYTTTLLYYSPKKIFSLSPIHRKETVHICSLIFKVSWKLDHLIHVHGLN